MAKPSGLAKISGSLLENLNIYKKLDEDSKIYSLVVVPGGGEDINDHFRKMGWEIKFCPLGRITTTPEQKEAVYKILRRNQDLLQDRLDELGITARIEIPFRRFGGVDCFENGDATVISCYNGFDKLWVYTLQEVVEKKVQWLKQLAQCFKHIETGELDKIEVVGFSKSGRLN